MKLIFKIVGLLTIGILLCVGIVNIWTGKLPVSPGVSVPIAPLSLPTSTIVATDTSIIVPQIPKIDIPKVPQKVVTPPIPPVAPKPSLFPAGYDEQSILTKINEQRNQNGLGSLVVNPDLTTAAQMKVNSEASEHYFAHMSPEGHPFDWFIYQSGFWKPCWVLGENLIFSNTQADEYQGEHINGGFVPGLYFDLDGMITAWMNSPEHRENILQEEYTQTGIAVQKGTLDGVEVYFVGEEFAGAGTKKPVGNSCI